MQSAKRKNERSGWLWFGVIRLLERSGLPEPDLVTFNSTLSQALRETVPKKQPLMAHVFLEQMPSRPRPAGGRPPGCCRRCLVAGWEEGRKFGAFALRADPSRWLHIWPNIVSYNTVLRACARHPTALCLDSLDEYPVQPTFLSEESFLASGSATVWR